VTLEVHVDAAGHADVLKVVKVWASALTITRGFALHHWQFAPARRNGVAVDSITNIDIAFSLCERGAQRADRQRHGDTCRPG